MYTYDWVTLLYPRSSHNIVNQFYSSIKEIDGETVADYFGGAPNSLQMVIAAMKLKDTYSLKGKLWPT